MKNLITYVNTSQNNRKAGNLMMKVSFLKKQLKEN